MNEFVSFDIQLSKRITHKVDSLSALTGCDRDCESIIKKQFKSTNIQDECVGECNSPLPNQCKSFRNCKYCLSKLKT